MKLTKLRAFFEQIQQKLQDYRSTVQFSQNIAQNLRNLFETLESHVNDKDFFLAIRESLLANADLSRLITNNVDTIHKYTCRLQGFCGEKDANDDNSLCFGSKFPDFEDFSANKQENIDVFIKQEGAYDPFFAQTLKSPLNSLPLPANSQLSQLFEDFPAKPLEKCEFLPDSATEMRDFLEPPNKTRENLANPREIPAISKRRGPYKKYSPSKKQQALDVFFTTLSEPQKSGVRPSTKKISKSLDIPCNTLKRWIKVGIYRRKGAGRKLLDPRMEERLSQWCKAELLQRKLVSGQEIRKMARLFSTNQQNFKASKGWLSGFLKRFRLDGAGNTESQGNVKENH